MHLATLERDVMYSLAKISLQIGEYPGINFRYETRPFVLHHQGGLAEVKLLAVCQLMLRPKFGMASNGIQWL